MLNGLMGQMGFDPTAALAAAAAGGGLGEMDSAEMAEKLAAFTNANLFDDLHMRTKMLEEMYGQMPATSLAGGLLGEAAAASTTAVAEPGETSSRSSKSRRKSATITKAQHTNNDAGEDELPEDLSIRTKRDVDSPSQTPSNEGRVSRVSEIGSESHVDKLSENNDGRSTKLSETLEGTAAVSDGVEDMANTPVSEGRESRTSHHSRAVVASPISNISRPSSRPTSATHSHCSTEDISRVDKSKPESPEQS